MNSKKIIKIKPESAYQFAVVGMGKGDLPFYAFKDSDRFKIRLVPEDDNKFDKRAIGVWIGDQKVGYVSRNDNKTLRRILKRDTILDYRLIKTYSYSAQWMVVDLKLSIKELSK